MRKLIIFLVVIFTSQVLFAQKTKISGKIVEENTKKPLEFVTVALYDTTIQKAIDGTTTLENGTFELTTKRSKFYIEISFMGFKTKKIRQFTKKKNHIALGTILLEENFHALDEVVLQAEKSTTEFKLDKRVFNVGKDLSSTGASALEVLNNVPSITVNIEGQVSLRGTSGVQMLINGKPSVLASEEGNALGTITADMIQKIEVITNPSAKYNAEGTGGIINIVLKKSEKRGLNGSITLNTGIPNNHSLGLSLNKRTEKFNLFSQFGIGYRTFPNERKVINKDFVNNSEVNSTGESDKNEQFYNVILGTDYHINDFNVLTLSGHFAYENEKENADTKFNQLQNNASSNSWNRLENTIAVNPKWQYELQYKKQFKDNKEHHLLVSATGDFFGKDKKSTFENKTISEANANIQQKSRTNFKESEYTYKIDYTKPFAKKYALELGSQYQLNDVNNDYSVSNLTGGTWVVDSNLTNIFNYNQGVLGVYGTLGYEGEKWGVKTGIRVENTQLKTDLKNTNQTNSQKYTDWFPSVHTSYKFTDGFSLQAGYSRRISRPRLWDLNPFFNLRNNFSIFTGNPDLKPEYSDSYEISSIHKIRKASFNLSLYHRYTTDVVEDVVTFSNNINTTKPENIGTNKATGFEMNGKYRPLRWLSFNGDFNYNFFDRKGSFNNQNFDFTGKRWSSRLTAKMKLPAKFDVEVSGNYRSKYKTYQSEISENWFANLGIRKKILKGKGVINLSIRDVFASRVRESISSQENIFYSYNKNKRGRFITIGFSYGFGKGEAMEFSGAKRF
ncbi:MAG: TonB-dependent receptor [Tenacibaculum sp.]|nr:TonB-dependent receptor [Tenacibaculum sp.]